MEEKFEKIPDAVSLADCDVKELIPQREPMIMIDKVVEFTEEKCSTVMTVKPDNIFVENGKLSAAGMVENMAQTCAARLGCVDKFLRNNKISIGYIGAVKDFEVFRLPNCGEEIRTTVTTITEAFGMTLVDAEIRVGEELLAKCQLKIAIAK